MQYFFKKSNLAVLILFTIALLSVSAQGQTKATFRNFNDASEQVTRFSTVGEAIDAHDGEIAFFEGVYYLYGTSYGCGFQWGKKEAPFCGFKTYTSTDMVH